MKPPLSRLSLALPVFLATGLAFAQTAAPADGPDPREIPLPPINTPLGRLPGVGELPVHPEMPDALTMNDGTKITTPAQWLKRREEIRRILEYYAVGQAPPPPGNVKGRELSSQVSADGTARYRLIHLSFGPEEKLGFDIGLLAPTSAGPFPAVISPGNTPPGGTAVPRQGNGPNQGRGEDVLMLVGRGGPPAAPGGTATPAAGGAPGARGGRGGTGGNPADTLARTNATPLAHGFAVVLFNNNDCGEDTTLRNADGSWAYRNTSFYPAYPNYDWGLLRGWAWGVSRIIDYLETDAVVDKAKIIVTGVSRTGKSALVAGAIDDRIALTAPVVTGGGGIGAYRFSMKGSGASESLDLMEKKYPNWWSPNLHEFWGQTEKLPFDTHWYLALIAPRAVIALEGLTDNVSFAPAVRASWLAVQPVFALLGATDRLGVNYANHAHAFTNEDWEAMLAFADQNLLGKKISRPFDQFPAGLSAAAAPAAPAGK